MNTTKIKKYINDHRDGIVTFSIYAGTAVAAIALVHYTAKAEAHNAAILDEYTRAENKLGNTVYQLANGDYISVPNA